MLCGVDEVGRGPIAGPVVACAVILGDAVIPGLTDSKKLSEKKREYYAEKIKEFAVDWAIGRATIEEIDEINILQATLLAMRRAVLSLQHTPELVLVDGTHLPDLALPMRGIIKGDLTEPCISAASIIAKVTRDKEMAEMDVLHPGYEFARHKGYPSPLHLAHLQQLGLSPIHRKTFGPCRKVIEYQTSIVN